MILAGSTIYYPDTGIFTNLKGKIKGTTRDDGYVLVWHENKLWRANRLAYFLVTGDLPECVDHKNRNTMDNRFSNLRPATKSENGMNTKLFSSNTSGCKGVSFCKQTQKWRVEIRKGKTRFRKRVDSFEEACLLSDKIRQELHGDFGNAN